MIAARAARILGSLALAGVLSACVSFVWSRERRFEPLPKGVIDGLEPGRTTFEECLQRLGAPLYVWEYKGDGAAIAWGASDKDSKQIAWTIPLETRVPPRFSYDDVDANLRGAVLFFDKNLVLESAKEGLLRDLQREAVRTRPALPPGPPNP
jgi:hypothetical protein